MLNSSRLSIWLREKSSRHTFILSLVISVMATVIVRAIRSRGYLNYLDLKAYDTMIILRLRPALLLK